MIIFLNQIKLEWVINQVQTRRNGTNPETEGTNSKKGSIVHPKMSIGGRRRKAKNNEKKRKNKRERIPRTISQSPYLITKKSVRKPKQHLKNSVHLKLILDFNFYETIYEIIDRGVTYQGPFKKYLPNGYGMCCFEKGEVYVGDFVNGEAEATQGFYIFFDGSYYEG